MENIIELSRGVERVRRNGESAFEREGLMGARGVAERGIPRARGWKLDRCEYRLKLIDRDPAPCDPCYATRPRDARTTFPLEIQFHRRRSLSRSLFPPVTDLRRVARIIVCIEARFESVAAPCESRGRRLLAIPCAIKCKTREPSGDKSDLVRSSNIRRLYTVNNCLNKFRGPLGLVLSTGRVINERRQHIPGGGKFHTEDDL